MGWGRYRRRHFRYDLNSIVLRRRPGFGGLATRRLKLRFKNESVLRQLQFVVNEIDVLRRKLIVGRERFDGLETG